MICPKCQSDDVYLCQVAHDHGKTTTKTTGRSTGYGNSASHGDGAAYGSQHMEFEHTATSTSLTGFAKQAAPPESTFGTAIGCFVVSLAVLFFASGWVRLVFLVLTALCAWWVFGAFRARPEFKAATERWKKSWICARCGQIFLPDEATAPISESVATRT